MMAAAVDPEQQLVPLAFALAESENDDSWSWFMRLVRINILGPMRQVCMISVGTMVSSNVRATTWMSINHLFIGGALGTLPPICGVVKRTRR
jgi:hypothetical protein